MLFESIILRQSVYILKTLSTDVALMTIMSLEENLDVPEKREKYTISVVGCGRIGLPTACLFAEAGFKVIGADVNSRVVALLSKGKAPLSETGLKELLKKHVRNGSFTATRDIRNAASTSDIIVLVVPTPIDRKKKPDYTSIERPCKEIGKGLRAGSLVIVASTTGPGITETVIKETLENASGLNAGIDFGLAYSPTRAAPGQVLRDIATYARVVGAFDEKGLRAASLVLSTIVKGEIVKVGERGQIVIPSKIRKKEKINSNSYVRVIDVDGRIVIDKVATKPIEKIIESLVSLGLTESDWKEIQKEREDER